MVGGLSLLPRAPASLRLAHFGGRALSLREWLPSPGTDPRTAATSKEPRPPHRRPARAPGWRGQTRHRRTLRASRPCSALVATLRAPHPEPATLGPPTRQHVFVPPVQAPMPEVTAGFPPA